MLGDPIYFLFAIPGLLLALWAQSKVRGTFAKFAQVPSLTGITGAEAARRLIQSNDLNVDLKRTPGELTDHYDPRNKVVALSDSSTANSIASVAVVAHEIGHAMQDKQGSFLLRLRGAIVPIVSFGANLGPWLFMGGVLLGLNSELGQILAWLGVAGFGAAALFALITLPVEFDASRRAIDMIQQDRLLADSEIDGAKQVLNAAALTYVAGAAQALLTLLYFVFRLTGMSRRGSGKYS